MNNPAPISVQSSQPVSELAGVNVLLEGPTGTGKTHAIGTLVDFSPSLDVFYLALESGIETLRGYWRDKGKDIPSNLHWHVLNPADSSFSAMLATATDINRLTNDALAKIQDPNKSKYNGFIKLLNCLNNFTDQRTNLQFGAVDTWGPNRCLVVDALTGINNAAMSLCVGGKPIKSLVDWGVAMDQVEKLIRQLCDGCKCHFVLLAHVERETDQVLGGVKITVGTLGQKLSAKIPPMFSDVVLAARSGTNFEWSTANVQADLKARNLPISEHITPDFKLIFDKWISRGGAFSPTVKG